jgi:hypothetical protein
MNSRTVEGSGCFQLIEVSGFGQRGELDGGDMGVQIFWVGLSPDESVPIHR